MMFPLRQLVHARANGGTGDAAIRMALEAMAAREADVRAFVGDAGVPAPGAARHARAARRYAGRYQGHRGCGRDGDADGVADLCGLDAEGRTPPSPWHCGGQGR